MRDGGAIGRKQKGAPPQVGAAAGRCPFWPAANSPRGILDQKEAADQRKVLRIVLQEVPQQLLSVRISCQP